MTCTTSCFMRRPGFPSASTIPPVWRAWDWGIGQQTEASATPFKSDLLVQIGVADASVCCPMPQSHARQTGGIVDADGNPGRRIKHEVVHVMIPLQRRSWIQVSESEDVVGTASR